MEFDPCSDWTPGYGTNRLKHLCPEFASDFAPLFAPHHYLAAMSDDEIPMGGMGDEMGDDMSDDMDVNELPDGVQKEIIREAPAGTFKTPKAGDEVTVHYVGTLHSDGTEFDSSRSRDKAFTFTLGQGQVIKGWDVGVASMKKGELAKFTLAAEYAYGSEGHPPKIPENASLVFEVELLDFVSKDDLFGDGGVIKLQVAEGSGWKTPKEKTEVRVSLKISKVDGSPLDDKGSFEHHIGSGALPMAKAIDKALVNMKKGEHCQLTCSKEYVGDSYPDGAVLDLILEEMYEIMDVSPAKDQSLMKKQVKEGEGYEKPKDSFKAFLRVESATDSGGKAVTGFSSKTLEFVVGDGSVCDALEFAVTEMKKGERAILTAAVCQEAQLGLTQEGQVILTLELEEFEKAKDTWDMSEEEKLEFGATRKDVGAKLFKASRFQLALERYKKVADLFSYIDNYKEENKAKAAEMKKICTLNKAACQLKLKLFSEAKASCNIVLKDSSDNVKALFRRAQADFGLKNYMDCIGDVKKVLEFDPQNREARVLAKDAQAGQKEEDKKSKGLFGKMCQALGKGPIPEPYKEKKFDLEDEADMADDMEVDESAEKGQVGQEPAMDVKSDGVAAAAGA